MPARQSCSGSDVLVLNQAVVEHGHAATVIAELADALARGPGATGSRPAAKIKRRRDGEAPAPKRTSFTTRVFVAGRRTRTSASRRRRNPSPHASICSETRSLALPPHDRVKSPAPIAPSTSATSRKSRTFAAR